MAVDLTGQVAWVTGGGTGIGRAIALALGQAGAAVALTGRTRVSLEETASAITNAGGRARVLSASVSDRCEVVAVVREVEKQLGQIDLLVNNAGVFRAIGPLWEVDLEDWWQNFEVNVRGVMVCAQAVLPGMIARRRGRIVNISSVSANGGLKYMVGYATSKTAALRLTEKLDEETRENDVRVFGLDPGYVYTPMADYLHTAPAAQRWMPMVPDAWKANAIPPERTAEATVWLASGAGDSLGGLFIQAVDDLAALAAEAEELRRQELRVLRIRRAVE